MSNKLLFSDIRGHWAEACILELANQKLILGDPKGLFRPDDPITRAEFATVLYWVFPKVVPVRRARERFVDVPRQHWASKTVKWAYERGFFSGYPDQTFQPDRSLSRLEALLVLVNGLQLPIPDRPEPLLSQYFDDAAAIPKYGRGAIAAALQTMLIVNYPDVRKVQPNRPATRADVAAFLCQVLQFPEAIPSPYVPWSLQLHEIQGDLTIPWSALRTNPTLVKDLQTRLSALQLHPGGMALDGTYDPQTEAALFEFCNTLELPSGETCVLNQSLAQTLLATDEACFNLERARDRDRLYSEFLAQEEGFGASHLAFLDKGIYTSPYQTSIFLFPNRLQRKPDGQNVLSSVSLRSDRAAFYRPFPSRGQLPQIDPTGLDFLHPDIPQACVCLAGYRDGQLHSRWWGRNHLSNVELWSSTKFVPLLNIAARASARFPESDLDDCVIRFGGGNTGFRFYDLALDVVTYDTVIADSNSLAAMFKQFDTPENLENWVKAMTGNLNLQFQGRYGSNPFIGFPELWDTHLQQTILSSPGGSHRGNNDVSAYDLTRLLAMAAWHPHLPPTAQLLGAQWRSLDCIIRALAHDPARYIDIAFARLGLTKRLEAPVILSKLGFGRSGERNRTELVYSALVQFVDKHHCQDESLNPPGTLYMLSMTLLGAKGLGDGDREAREIDARMAAEVTEILRRVVTQELG